MSYSNITKRALASAMKELMQERPFSKINVGDICEACGLNRKSFYYHFQDKYDLVNWIFQTEFISAIQATTIEDGWAMLQQLCVYFYNNRDFYKNALEIHGQNSFPEYFRDVMTPITQVILMGILDKSDQVAEFTAHFYTDAFLCAIIRWLTGRECMPAEQFLENLRLSLELGARRVISEVTETQKTP